MKWCIIQIGNFIGKIKSLFSHFNQMNVLYYSLRTASMLCCWYYSTGSMVFLRIFSNFLEQTYGRFLSNLVKIFQQWSETLGWSRSGFMIQDHSDHFYGASKVHEDYRDEIIAWFCPVIIIDQLCMEHNTKVWTHLFGQELIACKLRYV